MVSLSFSISGMNKSELLPAFYRANSETLEKQQKQRPDVQIDVWHMRKEKMPITLNQSISKVLTEL